MLLRLHTHTLTHIKLHVFRKNNKINTNSICSKKKIINHLTLHKCHKNSYTHTHDEQLLGHAIQCRLLYSILVHCCCCCFCCKSCKKKENIYK